MGKNFATAGNWLVHELSVTQADTTDTIKGPDHIWQYVLSRCIT